MKNINLYMNLIDVQNARLGSFGSKDVCLTLVPIFGEV